MRRMSSSLESLERWIWSASRFLTCFRLGARVQVYHS